MELCLLHSGPIRHATPSSTYLGFTNGVVRDPDLFLRRYIDRPRPHVPEIATKVSSSCPQYRGIHVANKD